MTTTDTPTTEATTPEPEQCPKGCGPLNHIEGTDVLNCNTCGYLGGDAPKQTTGVPRETNQGEAVKPDEVLGAGESPSTPPPDAPAGPTQEEKAAAFEHLAETANLNPGDTTWDEVKALAITARILSMSPLVPKFLRNNPWACFHIGMIGRKLGIDPTSAVELIDIMPEDKNDFSKGGRPMLSPELLNGQIKRMGLGSIVPLKKADDCCIAVALEPGGGLDRKCVKIERHFYGTPQDYIDLGFPEGTEHPDLGACQCHGIIGETEFGWAEATTAELVGALCRPGDHKKTTRNGRNGGTYSRCDCNQGYITYPSQMMWWRGSHFCQSTYIPEASIGLYSAEELGNFVDQDGRMIDPSTIELPPGFEPEPPPPAPEVEQATDAERAEVMRRISDLPSAQQTELKARWTEKQREERLQPVAKLTAAGLRMANALVGAAEAEAKRAGWKPSTAPQTADRGPGTADPDSGVVPPGEPASTAPASGADSAPPVTDTAEAPSDAPNGTEEPTAPAGMAPDLAAQWGQALPVITEAHTNGAIAVVKAMSGRALNDALRLRNLSVEGNADTRGARLAQVMVQETAQQDWEQANPERPTELIPPRQVQGQ